MNELIDQELKDEFFREFIELSQDVENYLLKLEQEPGNLAYVRELFRPFHTIKGNSGLINEKEIMQISQLAESVLDEVRQGRQKLTEDMLEVSLKSIDIIREISQYRDARPLKPRIDDVIADLNNILNTFDILNKEKTSSAEQKGAMPYSLHNMINFKLPVESSVECVKNIEKLFSIVDTIRYQRNLQDNLPDLFDCVLELSFMISSFKPLDNINKMLKYIEMYLIVLNLDDSSQYSFEKWELLDKFRNDVMFAFYPIILNSLNIKILYYNEDDDIVEIKNMINKILLMNKTSDDLNENFKKHFIINLNVHHIPGKKEITALIDLLEEYSDCITLVQRYLGQNELWHSLSLLMDEIPVIKKSFWKAIFSVADELSKSQ